MVYAPVATVLLEEPGAMAIALIVIEEETAMGEAAEKSVELVVGVDPSVV
jgi:hypothetical protein